MPYLVDGNNVMAQRVGWHRDKPRARRGLLDELARFARIKRARVTVVFDGAPEQHFADGSSYRGVLVFYAERGSNADERIKALVEGARERRTLIVVTSDRALAGYVGRCGARVLRASEFRRRMEEALSEAGGEPEDEGGQGVAAREVDGWMRYFGVGPEDDES
ncbi:MAG TPA: NYN domain-containing protein [Pyrinomonadaceae bacterium]|jgi:predicted RNA-binding protein with PIN domain|nr:NYN domain-containing protein [Pyrinomonadaceae bacterium]